MIYFAFTSNLSIPLAAGTIPVVSCEDDKKVRDNLIDRRMKSLIAQEKAGTIRNVQLYESDAKHHGRVISVGRWKGMVIRYTIYYDVAVGTTEWDTTTEHWYFSPSNFERDQLEEIFKD